jgi:hypothetical protein
MACCLIPIVIALLAYSNLLIVQLFNRRKAGKSWWNALALAWLAGAGLGVWSGFFFEYQPSPKLKFLGFPVPVVVFQLEGPPGDEDWVDFPGSPLFALSDILIMALLVPWWIGTLFLGCHRNVSGSANLIEHKT